MTADVLELVDKVREAIHAVQTLPLTHAELRQRWGNPDERTFQRWREELGLRPFAGRGASALYRLPAVLRAEERGELQNGGAR